MALPIPESRDALDAQRCPAGGVHQPVGTHPEFYTARAQTDRERNGHGWIFGDTFFVCAPGEKDGTCYGMFLCWRCGLFYAAPARFQRNHLRDEIHTVIKRMAEDLPDPRG